MGLYSFNGLHPSILCFGGIHSLNPKDFGVPCIPPEVLASMSTCCQPFERQMALAHALDGRPELLFSHTYLLCETEQDCILIREWLNPFKTLLFQQSFVLGNKLLPWNVLSGKLLLVVSKSVARDSISGLEIPTLFHEWPGAPGREALTSKTTLNDSYLAFFVISRTTRHDGWQWRLFRSLLANGRWGCIGRRHNFLIPLLLTDEQSAPNVESGTNYLRFGSIITHQGIHMGDVAFKLIAPIHLLAIKV